MIYLMSVRYVYKFYVSCGKCKRNFYCISTLKYTQSKISEINVELFRVVFFVPALVLGLRLFVSLPHLFPNIL